MKMTEKRTLVQRAAFLFAVVFTASSAVQADAQQPGASFRPVTQAELNDPDPANWLMWRGGYRNWGYSELDQ